MSVETMHADSFPVAVEVTKSAQDGRTVNVEIGGRRARVSAAVWASGGAHRGHFLIAEFGLVDDYFNGTPVAPEGLATRLRALSWLPGHAPSP